MNETPKTQNTQIGAKNIQAMEELGLILKEIYISLKRKGFKIVDGQLIKPNTDEKEKTKQK